jgi:hypothetical protein
MVFLRGVRADQIALAIYESYIYELNAALASASAIIDPGESRERRDLAWLKFRQGLNALWLLEGPR